MKNIVKILDMNQYFWVPLTCFGVFLLIGIGLGFWKGWKKAVYYLGWDIAALIIAVFATKPLLVLALKDVDTSNMPVDVKQFFFDHRALMPIAMIAWFIVLKPIAMLVQIPFRGWLKTEGMKSRWIGAGVSFIGAIPASVLSANAFTLISGKNFFSPASDALVKGITLGYVDGEAWSGGGYDGVSNYVSEIKNTLDVSQDKQLQQDINDLFAPAANSTTPSSISDENHKKIEDLLKGSSAPLLLKNASGDLKKKLEETGSNKNQTFTPVADDKKFKVDQAQIDKITDVLKNQYGWDQSVIDSFKAAYVA